MSQKQIEGSAKKDETSQDQLKEALQIIETIQGPSALQMNDLKKQDINRQSEQMMLIEHDQSLMNSQMSDMNPNLNDSKNNYVSSSQVSSMISGANQLVQGRFGLAQKPPSVPKKASQKLQTSNANFDRTLHDSSAQIINERRIIDCNNLGSKKMANSQVSHHSGSGKNTEGQAVLSARRGYNPDNNSSSLGASSIGRKQGGQSAGRQYLKKQHLGGVVKQNSHLVVQAPFQDPSQINANVIDAPGEYSYQSSPQVVVANKSSPILQGEGEICGDPPSLTDSSNLNNRVQKEKKWVSHPHNRSQDPRSKKSHKMHKRQSTQISGHLVSKNDLTTLPGGPLIKAAAEAGMFQNKNQQIQSVVTTAKRSKSKKTTSSKDSHLLKAYFPQIIHKKDIVLVTNTTNAPVNPNNQTQIFNVKDLTSVVQNQQNRHWNGEENSFAKDSSEMIDGALKTRYSQNQQDSKELTAKNTALDSFSPLSATDETSQILGENSKQAPSFLQDGQEMGTRIKKLNSDMPTNRQAFIERRRNSEVSPEKYHQNQQQNSMQENEFKSKFFPPIKKNMKKNRQKSQNRGSNSFVAPSHHNSANLGVVSPQARPSQNYPEKQPKITKANARDQKSGGPVIIADSTTTNHNIPHFVGKGMTSPQSMRSDPLSNGAFNNNNPSNSSSNHQRLSSLDDQPNSHPQASRKQTKNFQTNVLPPQKNREQSSNNEIQQQYPHHFGQQESSPPSSQTAPSDAALLMLQFGQQQEDSNIQWDQYNALVVDGNQPKQPVVDYEQRNQDKLRQMQEERNRELQEIENQRARVMRRQEKLKQNILREAQVYKEQKALRALKEAEEKEKIPIKLTNQKSAGNSRAPFKSSNIINSPERVTNKNSSTKSGGAPTTQGQQSPPSTGPRLLNHQNSSSLVTAGANVSGVTHPPNQSASALAAQEQQEDDGKTAEERAEEKKRLDMMRKIYRNRYHTFLKQLQEQKAKKEEEERAVLDKEAAKKQKIKNKVLGDPDKIKARVFEEKKEAQIVEEFPPDMFKPTINPVKAPSTKIKPIRHRSRSRSITRGHTATSSLLAAEKAYISDKDGGGMGGGDKSNRENMGGSRGSTRAASTSQKHTTTTGITTNSDVSRVQASRTATNFTGSSSTRGRTLTPKAREATKRDLLGGRNKHATQDLHMAALSPEDQLAFDETREEEMLKIAAEKKARAQKIRERQDKQLNAIKEKLAKEKQKTEEEEQRKLKLKELARQNVLMRADELKNMPTLREQQDSRLQKKRKQMEAENGGKTSPNRGVATELKPVNPESIKAFLQRNLKTKEVFLNITDINQWKKKHRVEPETKVFICKGGYKDIKRALKSRGWVENKDGDSLCFDLKWMLKSKDIPTNDLTPNQIVNHFYKATSITTKVGLTHSLKNLIWFNAVDIDTFYPRCYDLGIEEEQEDFVQEFKQAKAQCYLKIYVREMREAYETADGDVSKLKSKTVNSKLFKVAMRVCSQRTRELDDLIDDPNGFEALVSENDWKILGANELNEETFMKKKHDMWNKKNQTEAQKRARKEAKDKEKKEALKRKQEEEDQDDDDYYDEEYDAEYDDEENNEILVPEDEDASKDTQIVESSQQDEIDLKIGQKYPEFATAIKVMKALRATQPQFDLDGERNIWILKPAGSSRGRGICLKKDLVEIMDICKQKETQYVCQKYMENSLLMMKRKFDIRQWVLVTDWNPLTIWLYAEPYIRFPAADFSFDNLTNRYAHLSNNSVAKNGKKVKITHHIDGNMWTLDEFQDNLEQTYGFNVWEDKIQEGIKNIVIHSLESVQDMFEMRKGQQFELFGYDIMLDDNFNSWLIEVNSSPAMDYSTHVTERLVKMVSEDTIKVVVDYASASQKKKPKIDTGGYECIYKAKRIVDKPMGSFGLNLEIQGKKIPKNHLRKY